MSSIEEIYIFFKGKAKSLVLSQAKHREAMPRLPSFLMIVIIGLIIFAAAIIILWIMPWTWPVAAVSTVFFLIIAIPLVIIAAWMQHILDISSRRVPGKPSASSCFDKNTIIKTKKGPIKIKNIKAGTILENGDRVSAIFKLAFNNLDIFNL